MDVAYKQHKNWSRLPAALGVGLPNLQGRRARGNKLYNKKKRATIRRRVTFPPAEIRYV